MNLLLCGKIVSKIISKLEGIKMSYMPIYQLTDKLLSIVADFLK